MRTALRDMQPWRRALLEVGISFEEIAAKTGKSVHTVQAYSDGRRRPSPEWVALVEEIARAELERQETVA